MNVSKYTVQKNLTIFNKLFLKGDELFIEAYDPVNGKDQRVFTIDRTYLGVISSDFYWELEQNLRFNDSQ